MRPRPFSTEAYLKKISTALRGQRQEPNSCFPRILQIAIYASAWLAFLWLILWLASIAPQVNLHDRRFMDPANPQLGDEMYYNNHFWVFMIPPGKVIPEWVDP